MREKSIFKARILQYLEYKGISKYECCMKTGIANGVLSQANGLSEENILRFHSCYKDVNPAWLMTGKGDMLVELETVEYGIRADEIPVVNDSDLFYQTNESPCERTKEQQKGVPLYDLNWGNALVALLLSETVDPSPAFYLSLPNISYCDGAVYVRGESMYPVIKSGDVVLYKKVGDLSNILWGEMYLIAYHFGDEEYVALKYIRKVENDPQLVSLESFNEHFAPLHIPATTIRALALIKGSFQYHTMG